MDSSYRYRAFVSYSHQDQRWATWLQKKLERYQLPTGVRSDLQQTRPLSPVFVDRSDLATSSDLHASVEAACRESESLIVLCSPAAAKSPYVNEEILLFKQLGRQDQIFPIIVDGEPHAEDLNFECFPAALRFEVDDNGELTDVPSEPLASDARPARDGKSNALLKLIAGLLDVHFDDLKRRELQASQRRASLIATAAVALAVVFAGLAVMAYIARVDAERRRVQAEDLIGFMLGDLRQKLTPVGRLDVLDAVGDKAMDYFESLPEQDWSEVASMQRAKALRQIGEVRKSQGRLDDATLSFLESKRILELAHKRSPDHQEIMFELAQSHFWVADSYFSNNEFQRATQQIQHYRDISQQLTLAAPDSKRYWLEFSYAESNLGALAHSRGDYEEAKRKYLVALDIQKRLQNQYPEDTVIRFDLAGTYSWLGTIENLLWNLDAAISMHEEEVSLRESIESMAVDKTNQRQLAVAYALLAEDYFRAGRVTEAAPLDQKSGEIMSGLVELDPENMRWYRLYLHGQCTLARNMIVSGGDGEVALTLLESNLSELQALRGIVDERSLGNSINHCTLLTANAKLSLGQAEEGLALLEADSAEMLELMLKKPATRIKGNYADTQRLAVMALLALERDEEAAKRAALTLSFFSVGDSFDADLAMALVELDKVVNGNSSSNYRSPRLKGYQRTPYGPVELSLPEGDE